MTNTDRCITSWKSSHTNWWATCCSGGTNWCSARHLFNHAYVTIGFFKKFTVHCKNR